VTVFGVISDRDLSLAIGRFLRRLKYRLKKPGSGCDYFVVNEWSEWHRHTHLLLRVDVELRREQIRALWAKTLPGVPFSCHCAPVNSPGAIANYVVKNLTDGSKKEVPPTTFPGRIYTYSRSFFTRPVAALWKQILQEWYPSSEVPARPQKKAPNANRLVDWSRELTLHPALRIKDNETATPKLGRGSSAAQRKEFDR
jgi:hypothetical protein